MIADFKSRLTQADPLVGMVITLDSPEIAEMAAAAGFDWLWLDMEHGLLDVRDVQLACMAAAGKPCLTRVPVNDEAWIKRVLDTGVTGLIIPQVNTPEMAYKAAQYTLYPPRGKRSVGAARAHGYGVDFDAYLARANQDVCLFVQIEHVEAVENLEKILAVEGLSGIIIGPYDLSASMGITGQINDPRVVEAIEYIRVTCAKHAIPAGIFAGDQAGASARIRQGFKLVTTGTDVMLLSSSLGKMRAAI